MPIGRFSLKAIKAAEKLAVKGVRSSFSNVSPVLAAAAKARELYTRQAQLARHEVQHSALGHYTHEVQEIRHAIRHREYSKLAGMVAREIAAPEYNLLRDVQRYAKGGPLSSQLAGLINRLGPVGQAINFVLGRTHLMDPASVNDYGVQRAIDLLRGIGYVVSPPRSGTAGTLPPGGSKSARGAGTGGGSGPTNQPTTGGRRRKPNPPWHTNISPPPPGGRRAQPGDLPEGQFVGNEFITMYMVSGSSNVRAIGYNADTKTMRVQYLGSVINAGGIRGRGHKGKNRVRGTLGKTVTGKKHGAGPVYDYHGVPPRVFERIYSASSKGAAIWDNLRIRGTVYGHQYDYELVAAGMAIVAQPMPKGGFKRIGVVTYVPRKAVGPGAFKSRSIKQGANTFRSLLPTVGIRKGRLSP